MTTLTGKQIPVAHLLALRQMLILEMKGMKRRGRTAYAILKSDYGLKGSRETVLATLNVWRNHTLSK